MKTVIIVQARMTSTRLPGKVLKPVLGKSLLSYQIERLRNVKLADELVIATTTNETDQPLIDLCKSLDVAFFRGSEDDVLARYYGAAAAYRAETVVRLTSDCPVIDPGVVDNIIKYYNDHLPLYDYVSNTLKRSYPRGMDTEVFSAAVLKNIFLEAAAPSDREHVTPFIYKNPDRYNLANITYKTDESRHRWTVDTREDYELIKKIIEALYPQNPNYTLEDILKLFERNPGWFFINSLVEQKKVY